MNESCTVNDDAVEYRVEERDPLSAAVIGAAIEVYRELGSGLLESAYEECLCREFSIRGLKFERQVPLPVTYKGVKLDCGYRIDLLVEGRLVLEIKTVDELSSLHSAQVITYLKIGRYSSGLLINFNVPLLRNGIKRFVN